LEAGSIGARGNVADGAVTVVVTTCVAGGEVTVVVLISVSVSVPLLQPAAKPAEPATTPPTNRPAFFKKSRRFNSTPFSISAFVL
jgi:hypothetical protein